MFSKQIFLLTGLALMLFTPADSTKTWAENGLRVMSARYGAGGSYQDVTRTVRSFVRNQAISFQVNNQNLQTDPAPGIQKELIVLLENRGKTRKLHILEGDWFIVPEPESGCQPTHHGTGKLEIIRALYGSGGKYRIVTGIIQSHIHRNNINMRVSNENLGGDPTPNREKEMLVIYRKNDREYGAHLREGSWFIVID